ncbi:MSL1 protein [Aphomia sociella]
MNSRSSVNETNLVNFCGSAADLSTLNQLDAKDDILSFPFDHIYACHSESSDRRQSLQLEKEVEISTHCVVTEEKDLVVNTNSEVNQLSERIAALENQNKKLKDLLIYHLDLIQQQNELITKREKLHQALKQENDTLKNKLNRRILNQRQSVNPSTLLHVPPPNVTSTVVKSEPSSGSQIMLNSFPDLLLPDSRSNSFLFDGDINKSKPFGQDTFAVPRATETEVTSYLPHDIGVSSILDNKLSCDNFTMIESKRSFIEKEMKTENRAEPLYTVTSNSGNPVIQRIQRNRRRTSSGIGCLSRMSKSPGTKIETPESSKMFDDDKNFDRTFSVNKKSKMINTYGKNKTNNPKRTSQFTGSLSDRLQLIDTTPTGEDPYQLGEADMREQSPIPKLMLQKTNHGRMKICTDTMAESTVTSRRIYDTAITDSNTKVMNKMKLDRYNLLDPYMHTKDIIKKESPKTLIVEEPDLDIVKTEPEIDWRVYNPNKPGNETSLCDFSYGENPDNLASQILPTFEAVELQDLFVPEFPLPLDGLNTVEYSTIEKSAADKSKKRGARTTSLIGSNITGNDCLVNKRVSDSKRGRKRALSTTGLMKAIKRENCQKAVAAKPKLIKGKAACRGKKSPLPGMMTNKPYHTLVGDPDLSWYYRLDPHIKLEDIDTPQDCKVSTVEVPRWREKPYTSCYTLEGTENLDDKVFEKRHQKLEAEERRQLRWHMRRIREQRHVERLRQRQRDSWCGGGASPAHQQPSVFTVWPQPQRDVRFIEITDTLPVMAFGEIVPALPESDFMLPWVRTSKALKRSKRSKTLH